MCICKQPIPSVASLGLREEVPGMNLSKTLVSVVCFVAGLVALTPICARAALITFEAPGPGPTHAYGLNDGGSIVGAKGLSGYIRSLDGSFKYFDHPDATGSTSFMGINNSNDTVGFYHITGPNGGTFSFLRRASGDIINIVLPESARTIAYSINDSGDVVGFFNLPGSPISAFRYRADGTFETFDEILGHNRLFFSDINNFGTIAGGYYTGESSSPQAHGFLLDTVTGQITPFDFPGAYSTWIYGVNDGGMIAGRWDSVHGKSHGFVADITSSLFLTFDIPGADSTEAWDINNGGMVVGQYGYYVPGAHTVSAFYGVPEPSALIVPEPSRFTVLSFLGALVACRSFLGLLTKSREGGAATADMVPAKPAGLPLRGEPLARPAELFEYLSHALVAPHRPAGSESAFDGAAISNQPHWHAQNELLSPETPLEELLT